MNPFLLASMAAPYAPSPQEMGQAGHVALSPAWRQAVGSPLSAALHHGPNLLGLGDATPAETTGLAVVGGVITAAFLAACLVQAGAAFAAGYAMTPSRGGHSKGKWGLLGLGAGLIGGPLGLGLLGAVALHEEGS